MLDALRAIFRSPAHNVEDMIAVSKKNAFVRIPRWLRALLLAAGVVIGAIYPMRASAQCEVGLPIVFADLDWDSARLHTAIASYIVRHGFDCGVEYAPGGTVDSFAGLSTGDVDVMMEVWKDNFLEKWETMEDAGFVVDGGVNYSNAVQGWFVPRYLVDGDEKRGIKARAPDLKSVFDLRRHKHVFAEPSNSDTGVFMNCVSTWTCEAVNTKKLKIYGLSEHFTNRRAESGDALAEYIKSRYAAGKPFLVYYWVPTWILGAYDLVMLKEPPYDELAWQDLVNSENPDRATSYPPATVYKGMNFLISLEAPGLLKFLRHYNVSTPMTMEWLAFRQNNGLSIDETAERFIATRQDIWKGWVPDHVAKRLQEFVPGGRTGISSGGR